MKKYICILLAMCFLSGCAAAGDTTGADTEPTTEAEAAAETPQEEEDEFTRDDFMLYADNEGLNRPIVWLGMRKELVDENISAYPDYFEGIDSISYDTEPEIVDGKAGEGEVEYVSLISYTGSLEYVETKKGIRTSGLYEGASKPNSTAAEVIEAYGLDPDNESIYIGDPSGDNYTVALYFNIDNNNRVKRMISSKGADISDIAGIPGADYFIKFMITSDEVTGIQMYRRKRAGTETEG